MPIAYPRACSVAWKSIYRIRPTMARIRAIALSMDSVSWWTGSVARITFAWTSMGLAKVGTIILGIYFLFRIPLMHINCKLYPTFRLSALLGYEWIGWRNDTLSGRPVEITFEFETVRNFSAVIIHTNNMFSKDVQVSLRRIYQYHNNCLSSTDCNCISSVFYDRRQNTRVCHLPSDKIDR